MKRFDRTLASLIFVMSLTGCTRTQAPPATRDPAPPPKSAPTVKPKTRAPVPPPPSTEAAEKPSEYSPLKGCGMVTADDNQGVLDVRVVTTEKYCDQSTADMDLRFTALVDKKTKKYPDIFVNAILVDPVRTLYKTVRFTRGEKTVERKATSEYIEKFCRSAGKCEHYQSVTFEVDRSVVEYWATKGGVVRFGKSRELKIDPKEAADFLKKLEELGATEAGKSP